MRFDIITLFPELFGPMLEAGVTRRAFCSGGPVQIKLWQLRDFAEGPYRRVDDRPFGGGPGMVMQAEPLWRCLQAIRADRADPAGQQVPVVLFSPAGKPLNHGQVQRWAGAESGAILVCGRYEGVDQRFVDACVDEQISLGDFVLSGGEIPAMALLDAVARLQPGVLQDADSHAQDSFNPALDGLLDCPHYTRPESWQGRGVPEVLLSGNHAAIAQWRHAQRVQLTRAQRPDLLEKSTSSEQKA
ncbi:MAG: tRNA (guanosine(37)-N1)-methyltransferase TrmD [Brachymonas sp.]